MRTIHLPQAEVQVYPDPPALNAAVAEEIRAVGQRAGARSDGRFAIALAGGSTPRSIYALLAEEETRDRRISWNKTELFFGDERMVPPGHADSNYRMAYEALLSRVPIPEKQIHRVRTEHDAASAARDYEAQLRAVFQPAPGTMPAFDLILLGMGADGHTASLFPGSLALAERNAMVFAHRVEELQSYRITFTFPLLNAAHEVLVVVSGSGKAEMLGQVLRGDPQRPSYPVQGIRPKDGRLIWMTDEAAAAAL